MKRLWLEVVVAWGLDPHKTRRCVVDMLAVQFGEDRK